MHDVSQQEGIDHKLEMKPGPRSDKQLHSWGDWSTWSKLVSDDKKNFETKMGICEEKVKT